MLNYTSIKKKNKTKINTKFCNYDILTQKFK